MLKEPLINIWFGNFYQPAYDDKEFVKSELRELKEMGFNAIQLDSKAWEDFRERCRGGEASQYVAQQEFMMSETVKIGLSYNFMSLYLCADNLYPNIRFSPPIFGESVTNPDGSDGRWYKYWSDKAQESMIEHVKELFESYGGGNTEIEINGKVVKPCCTMWDPIVAPSFDAEGRERYISWLRMHYAGIDGFNEAYKTEFTDFSELQKEDCWFSCAYPETPLYTKAELDARSPKVIMWADNMKWRIHELCEYFKSMQRRIHEYDSDIYTMPDMAQWSYFLNIDASALTDVGLADLWDTSNRGIDIYKLSKYVDCCHFTAVPITPYGDPDAYICACQHSMLRAMNCGREFLGGVYLGRFLYNDIYEFLTPCEVMGSITASGASGCSSYGACGLDDGGVLHRMNSGFKDSLKRGNEWARSVMPRIKGQHKSPAAILFPSEMSAFEPMGVDGNKERRMDLLGWYKLCCNAGCGCDVIDKGIICDGRLDDYKLLIIPRNDCAWLERDVKAEQIIKAWVENGGIILHSPMDEICRDCFGLSWTEHESSPIFYKEKGLVKSDVFASYSGELVASYLYGAEGAVVKNAFGSGYVYSFGFDYGYSYASKIAPHVPLSEKNHELYPIPLMKYSILGDILETHGIPVCRYAAENVETAEFDNCTIVVNHTSQPIVLDCDGREVVSQYGTGTVLMPRSAAAIF